MAVTLKDIAKAAGVSTSAVSHILHGGNSNIRVGEVKAAEIRRVAKDLNYIPNALARGLRVNRTHIVGVLFENFAGIDSGPLYIASLLNGVARTVMPRHYILAILSEVDHDDVVGSLSNGRLDGVIWCKMARDSRVADQIRNCQIPIVAMNGRGETGSIFVACDNRMGIELAIDHLVELGHQRILFVNEVEEDTAPDRIERRSAFIDAMERRGLQSDTVSWDWAMSSFVEYRKAGGNHTAIIGWSERCAGQILVRAREIGLELPGDLSVVGFDSTNYCETTTPRLTAIRQPIGEMAEMAARLLLRLIDGEQPECPPIFPCSLDVRRSTAAPRQKS